MFKIGLYGKYLTTYWKLIRSRRKLSNIEAQLLKQGDGTYKGKDGTVTVHNRKIIMTSKDEA